MKAYFYRVIHSLPVQLVLLHFRRYQVLLLFWLLLFAIIHGSFGKNIGADALLLDPEYLGEVSFYSTFILGGTFGIFIMSWNITTFILNSKRIRFLATTNNPIAKYCLNNAILPLLLFLYYIYRIYAFQHANELNEFKHILILESGFIVGLAVLLFITFTYFFGADRNISLSIRKQMGPLRKMLTQFGSKQGQSTENNLKVDFYLYSLFRVKRARKVDHYDYHFLDTILSKHLSVAVILIFIAFLSLIILGYLTAYDAFRIPAGASAILFISVLIAFAGAFVYIFKTWSLLGLIALVVILNFAIHRHIIHTSSKAYGLDYNHPMNFPPYDPSYFQKVFTPEKTKRDESGTLEILENWKNKFVKDSSKPLIVFLNVSGGGSRAATWTMNVMQKADDLLKGNLMQHTVLITGASGGMVAAAYYRELFLRSLTEDSIHLNDERYLHNVSKDLLNSVMASFVINDFFTPFRNFTLNGNIYPMDRAYAFEKQLNANLENEIEGKTLKDYILPEKEAKIPLLIFTPTFTNGGRKLFISSQRMSYLSRINKIDDSTQNMDGLDMISYFQKQDPERLSLTSAIRMNATFPYILPDVSLPTQAPTEVMDAGVRDNYGKTTSLRFIEVFRDWINENTGGVIFIQIRDKEKIVRSSSKQKTNLFKLLLRPLLTIQYNWSSFQNYEQDEMTVSVAQSLKVPFYRISFQYIPHEEDKAAPLSWHLTQREKEDIADAIRNKENEGAFKLLQKLLEND